MQESNQGADACLEMLGLGQCGDSCKSGENSTSVSKCVYIFSTAFHESLKKIFVSTNLFFLQMRNP